MRFCGWGGGRSVGVNCWYELWEMYWNECCWRSWILWYNVFEDIVFLVFELRCKKILFGFYLCLMILLIFDISYIYIWYISYILYVILWGCFIVDVWLVIFYVGWFWSLCEKWFCWVKMIEVRSIGWYERCILWILVRNIGLCYLVGVYILYGWYLVS